MFLVQNEGILLRPTCLNLFSFSVCTFTTQCITFDVCTATSGNGSHDHKPCTLVVFFITRLHTCIVVSTSTVPGQLVGQTR
jgi:hypothetical protein